MVNMKRLDRKLLRDLWTLKAQALAIALVMASGVATLVMMLSTVSSLRSAQQSYSSSGRATEILQGLSAGDEVMIHASDRVADGVAISAREQRAR
jgi:putative ABC transport system permease protein